MPKTRTAESSRTLSTDSQLMQDYLQSTGILVSTNNASVGQVAPFLNAEGQAEAIVIDPDGNPYHVCREPLSDSGWNMYGLGSGFQTLAAIDAATIWAFGNDGALWRSDNGRWTDTQKLPSGNLAAGVSAGADGTVWATDTGQSLFVKGPRSQQKGPSPDAAIAPAFVSDLTNRLNAFCIDTGGSAWAVRQAAAGGSWGPWSNLGAPFGISLTSIAVGANADGRLQVFAIGSDALVYTAWQQSMGGNWSGWAYLASSNPPIAQLAVAQTQDGRLQVWAVSTEDGSGNVSLYTNYQSAPAHEWQGWQSWDLPSGTAPSGLALLLDSTGVLQLILVYYLPYMPAQLIRQTGPNSWTDWQAISIAGGAGLSAPSLMANADGHLEVFALGSDGALWHAWEENGTWVDAWSSFGTAWPYAHFTGLAVGRNQDGRLEAFAQASGSVYHIWQTAPNSGWSGWDELAGATGPTLSTMAVVLDQFGSLEVLGVSSDNLLWQSYYNSGAAAGWQSWITDWWLWYPLANAPALAQLPSGIDGAFWAVGFNGDLISFDQAAWSSTTLPGGLSAACVAVDPDGTVWSVAESQGEFFRNVGNGFEQLPGLLPGANSLAAGGASCIWATAAATPNDYALFSFVYGGWQAASTPQLTDMDWNNNPSVSVGRDGSVWLLDGSGNAWRQTITSASWRWNAYAPPPSIQIEFLSAAPGGGAWAIDTTGTIWQFKGTWSQFKHPLPNARIAQISSGPAGTLWAIDTNGTPYGYTAADAWVSVADQFNGPVLQSPSAWAINAQLAYQYLRQNLTTPGNWTAAASWDDSYTAQQISAGVDGTVLLLDTQGSLHGILNTSPSVDGAPTLAQIAVVNIDLVWGITRDATNGAFALHLYADGMWRQVQTSGTIFTGSATPQLSSAGDGTVWLLDTNGIPRRLAWTARAVDWQHKDKSFSARSIAATNVNDASLATPDVHEAWAISSDGAFRRNYGTGWTDAYVALPDGASPAQVSVGPDGSIWAIDTVGTLYRRQAWTQGPAFGSGTGMVAATQDGNGQLHLFGIDASGQGWANAKQLGQSSWVGWTALPAPEPLALVLSGKDQTGTVDLFALSTSGLVYAAQQAPGSGNSWAGFALLAGSGQPTDVELSGIALGSDQNGALYLFGIGSDASIWLIQQQTSGWGTWTALPAISSGTPIALAPGLDPDGTLEVFILDDSNSVQHSWQDHQAPSGWSNWELLGATGQPSPVGVTGFTTGTQQDGPVFIAATGSDGAVYVINNEASSPDGWSDWISLGAIGGVQPLALMTASAADGTFIVLLQGSDGGIYSASLPPDGSNWGAWLPLGAVGTQGTAFQGAAAAPDDGGLLRVFSTGGGAIWQTCSPASTLTGWSDWNALSGRQGWQPCGVQNSAQAPVGNSSNLWTVFADGSVQTSSDGVNWTQSPFPSSASPARASSVSVGTDGTPWAVTPTQCYHYEYASSTWVLAGSGDFAQAPVGSAADLWSIDASGTIWRSNDGGGVWWQDGSYPGIAKQISVCGDGSVWVLDQHGTVSLAAAWQRIMRPTGMPGYSGPPSITDIVAADDENGVPFAFALIGGSLAYTYQLSRHAWLQWTTLPTPTALTGIRLTRQQDTGALIVYALATLGTIYYATKTPGQSSQFNLSTAYAWTYAGNSQSQGLDLSDLELSAVDSVNWLWFAAFEGTLYAGATAAGTGEVFMAQFDPPGGGSLWQLAPLPWQRSVAAPFCAMLDANNQLWLAAVNIPPPPITYGTVSYLPLTGQTTAIPNGTDLLAFVLQADMWTAPQPRIYAVASNTPAGADPALWMMCQTNVFLPPTAASAWSQWTPLGDNFASIFSGPPLLATDTLFAVDPATGSLDSLYQNPMTGVWKAGPINRPSQSGDDIVDIASYQTEATISDATGVPEANVPVTIFAATPVEAWVNNTLYNLGPASGITVRTNTLGKIVVKTIAQNLSAAELTFCADGLTATEGTLRTGVITVAPSGHVYGFLQGTEALPVGGGARTTFTPTALQGLKPSISDTTASTIVKDAATITAMPAGAATALGMPLVRITPPGGLPGSWWSDAWDDVKHAAESVAHAIEKGVVSAAIDIGDGVVKLTLYVGGELVTVFDMAIATVDDAIRAIVTIIKTWVTDLEDFIRWLRLLFDWENILATQKALRSFIEQAIGLLPQKIVAVRSDVATTFGSINAAVGNAFDSIIQSGSIGGDTHRYTYFTDLPSSASNPSLPPPPSARLGTAASPVPGSSSVHHNWFLTKVLDHVTPSFSLKAIPGLDASSFLDTLDLQNTISQLQNAGQDLLGFLQEIFADPGSFATLGIVDLLQAAQSLLLALVDLIGSLIKTFLSLIQTILAGIMDVLEDSVDIPLIGTLFEFLTGEDMDVLALGTLMIAVPLYLIYDILFDGLPFSGLGEPPAAGLGMSAAQQWANANLALGIVNWGASAVSDLITLAETPVVNPDEVPGIAPVISMFTNILALSMQIISWPDPNGFPFVSDESPSLAQIAVWFSWAVNWGPPLISYASKVVSDDAQAVIKTILGSAGMISGIVAAIEGLPSNVVTGAGAADLIVAPLSSVLAWLLVSAVRQEIWESSDLIFDPAYLIFVVDLIVNLAGPILNAISAAE